MHSILNGLLKRLEMFSNDLFSTIFKISPYKIIRFFSIRILSQFVKND
jgi:hypothetical protein